jgi:hypothetical protein
MLVRELLPTFLRTNFHKLSKTEGILLEANLFVRLSDEFNERLRYQYKNYQQLIKSEKTIGDEMLEVNFLRYLINDIISTNEYTLEGIANFIRIPTDAIIEIVSGINMNPSLMLAAKIIKLHADVRRDLYGELIKKVMEQSIN